jgi:hypothetical protein
MVVDGLFSYFILKRGQIGVEKVRVRVMMFNATITIFRLYRGSLKSYAYVSL